MGLIICAPKLKRKYKNTPLRLIVFFSSLTHKDFWVDQPKKYTRIFAVRLIVIVGSFAFELSSGTSNPGHNSGGLWAPSVSFSLFPEKTGKSVCKVPEEAFGSLFHGFGSIIIKDFEDAKFAPKADAIIKAVTIPDSEDRIARLNQWAFTKFMKRFKSYRQLMYSLMLSDHCEDILKGMDFNEKWNAFMLKLCQKGNPKLATVKPQILEFLKTKKLPDPTKKKLQQQ